MHWADIISSHAYKYSTSLKNSQLFPFSADKKGENCKTNFNELGKCQYCTVLMFTVAKT